jgi:hypothetical protein
LRFFSPTPCQTCCWGFSHWDSSHPLHARPAVEVSAIEILLTHSLLNLLLRFQPLRFFSPTHCQTCCRGQPLRFFSLTPFKTYGRDLAIETLLTQLTLVLLLSSLLARAWLSTLSTRYRVRSRFIGTCFLIDRVTHPGLSSLWSTAVVSSRTRQLTSLGSSTLWRRQLSTRRRRIWRLYGSKSCRELFLKSPSNEIDSF